MRHPFSANVYCALGHNYPANHAFRLHVHARNYAIDGRVPWVFGGLWEAGVQGSAVDGTVMQAWAGDAAVANMVNAHQADLLTGVTALPPPRTGWREPPRDPAKPHQCRLAAVPGAC